MKKTSIRSVLVVLLMVVSLSAYIFINSVEPQMVVNKPVYGGTAGSGVSNNNDDAAEEEDEDALMPDVDLIRTFIEKSKDNLPALKLIIW